MSHSSTSTTHAEPPFGGEPGSSDEERTLDLEGASDVASAAEETLVGCELQKGKYRVLALRPTLAGATLAGASYAALHTDLQRRLTLRYLPLDPNASAEERDETTVQFLREVRVLAKLDHPSLPRVHDYFCEGAACYVVMDELSEYTLAEVLAEAAQEGRMPALPPLMIAQIGVEVARALGYLHQQRPPLALGKLRAEDVALPTDGPAQLTSLGALSMVASLPEVALSEIGALPTLPAQEPVTGDDAEAGASNGAEVEAEEGMGKESCAHADSPELGADLYSLGVLLRELSGGAEVVARVMDRLLRPDEALQADGAEDVPPISLTLAAVIQVAAHDEPGRRFQSAAAFETALRRAWMVERRIVRQAERVGGDEQATTPEDEEEDLEATLPELATPEALLHTELATRQLPVVDALAPERPATVCWRCAGHNPAGARVCRVCGARQSVPGGQRRRATASGPRRRARPTRKLPPGAMDESAWAAWNEDATDDAPGSRRQSLPSSVWLKPEGGRAEAKARRPTAPPRRERERRGARSPDGRRLLWGLVWTCFVMAFLLGGATIVVTYLALR